MGREGKKRNNEADETVEEAEEEKEAEGEGSRKKDEQVWRATMMMDAGPRVRKITR